MDVQMVLQQAHQMVSLNNVIRLHLVHEFVVCRYSTQKHSICITVCQSVGLQFQKAFNYFIRVLIILILYESKFRSVTVHDYS